VICSGSNTTQVGPSSRIGQELARAGVHASHVEGTAGANWCSWTTAMWWSMFSKSRPVILQS
jgi:hypothetical protein